jgi:hypothetical protein
VAKAIAASLYKQTIMFVGNTMQVVSRLGATIIPTDYTATPTSFIFVNHGDSSVQTFTKP